MLGRCAHLHPLRSGDAPPLTVIGTGYLGATHAVCLAELGFDVLGLDADPAKVAALSAGEVPFFEPGLPELLRKNLESGRLRFTTSYAEVGAYGTCTSSALARRRRRRVRRRPAVRRRGVRRARVGGQAGQPAGRQVDCARRHRRAAGRAAGRQRPGAGVEPEFLREGFAVQDTLTPDRLVFGVGSAGAEQQLREAYAPVVELPTPVVVTDLATAQLVKVSANAFLATKISFINAMAEVCEATGADVTALSAGAVVRRPHRRALPARRAGLRGGCLPKDIRAFMARADELGVDQALTFLKEVDAINLRRRARMIDLARELVGGSFGGIRVAVLGAAFKPNSDDIRDSPALDVAATMQRQGAAVTVYDPQAMDNARVLHPQLGYRDSAMQAGPPRRPRAAPDRVGGVPPHGPGRARRGRRGAAHRRRAQCAGPGRLARRRLDLPRARPSLTGHTAVMSDVEQLLALQTWAVVGLSPSPRRAAYGVAQFLQARGRRIVPVHPSRSRCTARRATPSWPTSRSRRRGRLLRQQPPGRAGRRPGRRRRCQGGSGCSWASSTRRPPGGLGPPG